MLSFEVLASLVMSAWTFDLFAQYLEYRNLEIMLQMSVDFK